MRTFVPFAVTKIPARTKEEAYTWVYAHFSVGCHLVQACHDDGCLAIASGRDADCRAPCAPDWYLLTVVDDEVRNN